MPKPRTHRFRLLLLLSVFLLTAIPAIRADDAPTDSPEALEKIDDGLKADLEWRPVFIRMEEQLCGTAAAYPKFCKAHASHKRLELRREVIETLKRNSEQSWAKVEELLKGMEKNGEVRSLKRYWIVNGVACEAKHSAIKKLAKLESVSFIYRQRIPGVPLHFRPVPLFSAPNDTQKGIYQGVLEGWKDDSKREVSTEGVKLPWNVKRIKADQAWKRGATGKGVVVALCDTGLMVTPSLTAALWKNPGEKLNGKDDDNNGYVDDLFGYDFARQSWYALGDRATITHGSMCGGIIAGRPHNEEKLSTGIAPRSRLMVLRGMGLLQSYEYALENGADIMSMSYMWIRTPLGNYRGLYRTAHEHLAAAGIVAVGGAGNFRKNQPKGRQIALPKDIPCVIAAAGIMKDGSQAEASSEGPCYWEDVKFYDDYGKENPLRKPDVTGCFGGYPVWGRPRIARRIAAWELVSDEGDGVGLVVGPRGNSFSGPHAAGVAALMLSVNPQLTAWRVKELMEATCQDLGEPGRDDKFGAGLLDAEKAVQAAKENAARKLKTEN